MNGFFTKSISLIAGVCISASVVYAQENVKLKLNNRWAIQSDGCISWTINNSVPHTDHIEMAGEKVALSIRKIQVGFS